MGAGTRTAVAGGDAACRDTEGKRAAMPGQRTNRMRDATGVPITVPAMIRALVVGLLVVAAVLLAVAPSSRAASSPDDWLSCQLVGQRYVRSLLGVTHSVRRHSSVSPTSPSPNGHTVGPGADESSCSFFGWNGEKPSASQLKKIIVPGSSRYKIPPGLGAVWVTTYVRDPGTDGQSWDADAFFGELLKAAVSDRHHLGGEHIKVRPEGSDDRYAVTLGHHGDFATGVWQKGDSIIMLQVAAPRRSAAADLTRLASHSVPPFWLL